MGAEANRLDPAFFKIMIEGFQDFLYLPPRFVHNAKNWNDQALELQDSAGNISVVRSATVNGRLAFLGGWRDFVSSHGIIFGELLLFECTSSLRFSVRVFGVNACERICFRREEDRQEMAPSWSNKNGSYEHEKMSNAINKRKNEGTPDRSLLSKRSCSDNRERVSVSKDLKSGEHKGSDRNRDYFARCASAVSRKGENVCRAAVLPTSLRSEKFGSAVAIDATLKGMKPPAQGKDCKKGELRRAEHSLVSRQPACSPSAVETKVPNISMTRTFPGDDNFVLDHPSVARQNETSGLKDDPVSGHELNDGKNLNSLTEISSEYELLVNKLSGSLEPESSNRYVERYRSEKAIVKKIGKDCVGADDERTEMPKVNGSTATDKFDDPNRGANLKSDQNVKEELVEVKATKGTLRSCSYANKVELTPKATEDGGKCIKDEQQPDETTSESEFDHISLRMLGFLKRKKAFAETGSPDSDDSPFHKKLASFSFSLKSSTEPWIDLTEILPRSVQNPTKLRRRVVIIRDPSNREWPVLYLEAVRFQGFRLSTKNFHGFSAGWKSFVAANNLCAGDQCELLEVADESEFVYSARISRASSSTP